MSTANRYILTTGGNFYLVPSSSELYHHGVKGMRWGIRRTPQQLGHKVEKLSSKNKRLKDDAKYYDDMASKYEIRSNRNKRRNGKYEEKIANAERRKAKYDLKLYKEVNKRHPSSKKIGKFTVKSKEYEADINAAKRKLKYNKDFVKSEEFKNLANTTRDRIAKNDRLINMYSKTSDALESGSIQQGRVFMRYIFDEAS